MPFALLLFWLLEKQIPTAGLTPKQVFPFMNLDQQQKTNKKIGWAEKKNR